MKNYEFLSKWILTFLLFCAPFIGKSQYMRSYKSGSNINTSKGAVVESDSAINWDIAFGFGQTDEFEIEIATADDGIEPSYCYYNNHDYNGAYTGATNSYYPRHVIRSETVTSTGGIRMAVVGETDAGSINSSGCGTSNGYISCFYFSTTCSNPTIVKSIIFGKSGYTIEMRDAYEFDDNIYFTARAVECSGGASRILIGRLDNTSTTPVLTIKILTVIKNTNERLFQPKAIAVDNENIYVSGIYDGTPQDAFIMAIDKDVLLASGAPTNPTTILKTLFNNNSSDYSEMHDLIADEDTATGDYYIYGVGYDNALYPSVNNPNGVIVGFNHSLNVISAYEYQNKNLTETEFFRGITRTGLSSGRFLVSGFTSAFSADKDIFAVEIRAHQGHIFPQFIPGEFNNAHLYVREGDDKNFNIETCANGSHVTMFNWFTSAGIDNQYVIHTNNDLTLDYA